MLHANRTCFTLSCFVLCFAVLSLLPSPASADKLPNPWSQLLGRIGKDAQKGFVTPTALELSKGVAWTALPQKPSGLSCALPPDGPQHKQSIWWVFEGTPQHALELSGTEAAFWAVDETQFCLVRWVVATREVVCATPQSKGDPLLSIETAFESEDPDVLTVNDEDIPLKDLRDVHPAAAPSPSNPLAKMGEVKVGEGMQGFRMGVGFQGQPTSGTVSPTPPTEPSATPSMLHLTWHRDAAGTGDVFVKQACPVDGIVFGCSLAWKVFQSQDNQIIGHLQRASMSGGADRATMFSTGDQEESFWRWDGSADNNKGRWRPIRSEKTEGSSVNPPTCNDYDNTSHVTTSCEQTTPETTWRIFAATNKIIQGCEVQECPEGKDCLVDQCAFVTTEQFEESVMWETVVNGQTVLLGKVSLPKTRKEIAKSPCPVDELEDGMPEEGEGFDE